MMGTRLAERFVIQDPVQDLLGRGGMGDVYRATDTQTGETVAVKALNPEIVVHNPDLFERFAREGEALRKLHHPNIVSFIASVEEAGRHYLVVEHVPGGSLDDVLNAQGRLSCRRTIEIALDLADALTRAHRLGIIHRDLKPANVLMASDGTPRLADFGIAYQQSSERLTQTGVLVGTVDYLGPEVCQGEPPDERSDIWSFGVLLFRMLAGELPFKGENLTAKLTAILTQATPDITQSVPDIPDALADLVYRMLEKAPQQRIPSVRLVGAELEALLKGREPARHETRFATPTPPRVASRHNLPVQTTPFVGRQAELRELARLLEDPGVRLVSVVALGGMGKTRLAIEAGARLLERFPHGVWFVSLAGLETAEPMVPATAQAIGFAFCEGPDPRQQLLDYLREKHLLLIFDNFEHLLSGGSLVKDILHSSRGVVVLTTSRERLGLPEEHLFHLGGMDLPNRETQADALDYAALQLFLHGARRVRPGFAPAAEDQKHVARICRLVGGMPLGILLSAAWLEMLTPAEVATEMQTSLDFLTTDLPGVEERQRSIRAVLDYSWNSLTERERSISQQLSVFRGGFTRDAVQAITGASLRDLMGLVNKSLLDRAPTGRYEVHELLRRYGADKLLASGKVSQVRQCHLEYFAHYCAQLKDESWSQHQSERFSQLAVEVNNLRIAVESCLDFGDPLAGLRMMWDLHANWKTMGTLFGYSDARSWLVQLLAAAPQPTQERLHGLIALGHLIYVQGDYCEALTALEEGLALSESLGDLQGTADAGFFLSWAAAALGDHGRALGLLERSGALYGSLDDRVNQAYVVLVMGEMARQEGDLVEARRLHEQSVALHRQLKNKYMLPTALVNLAMVLIHFRELDRARELVRECWLTGQMDSVTVDMVTLAAAFLANAQGQPHRAACLLGYNEAGRALDGTHVDIGDRPDYERNLAELRTQLGDTAFEAAWVEGAALTSEQAIELALRGEEDRQ